MITFNNIPNTTRTPGVFVEVDNSKSSKGLTQNPHKVLIVGEKTTNGTAENLTLYKITSDVIADRYFGTGSILSRMCRTFRANNTVTDLYAIAVQASGGVKATGTVHFSVALSHNAGIVSTANEQVNLMINGREFKVYLEQNWSVADINSAYVTVINADSFVPVTAGTNANSALVLTALQSGDLGNNINFQFNYYDGQSFPTCFKDSVYISAMAGGSGAPDLSDVWSVIENEQFHHIIQPYTDASNLTSLETELEKRFKPLIDKQGIGYTAYSGDFANCESLGDSRNSPHNCIIGVYNSPSSPEEWAAAFGAVCAFNLNIDPARPLHYLPLYNILPPKQVYRFTKDERNLLLYDGITTWIVDAGGRVCLERVITTYKTNSVGSIDTSYLDIQTLATLMEIRYQFRVRMENRFLIPRFKLADDSFPVQPGSYVVTPKTIKQEIISLFTELRDKGLIENLEDFIENLVVERDSSDVNRVNVLLPCNLINQFRILAGIIQFIL